MNVSTTAPIPAQRRPRLLSSCRWLPAILLLAGLIQPSNLLLADQEGPDTGWVATSANHRFLFRMVPPDWDGAKTRKQAFAKAHGMAYALDAEGSLKELWRVEGWYASSGCLADDGRHFVRIGPWPGDQFHHSDLALGFYRDGKLLRSYQVRELLKDVNKAPNSVSHYQSTAYLPGLPDGLQKDGTFRLTLIDKTSYTFDITTGEIVTATLETGLKNYEEMADEESKKKDEEDSKRAAAFYSSSPFHPEYEALFTAGSPQLKQLEDVNGVSMSGVQVSLTPRKAFEVPCEVVTWLPLESTGQLQQAIPAQQLLAALEVTLAHPFVARRVADKKVSRVRLITRGDSLHKGLNDLPELLAEVWPGKVLSQDELGSWVELFIDAPPGVYWEPLVCLNLKTRQIIHGGAVKNPAGVWMNPPVLYDAKGEVSQIKTRRQLRAEAEQKFQRETQAFLDSAAFQKDYGSRFQIGRPEVFWPFDTGVDMSNPSWRVGLTPRRSFTPACMVRAQFVMAEVKTAGVVLAAEEVEKTLQLALDHPVVKRLLGSGPQGHVSLHISHNRLHWSTADLRGFLTAVHVPDTDGEASLSHWAELHVQGGDPMVPPDLVYLNTQSRDLVETSVLSPGSTPPDPFASAPPVPADPFGGSSPAPAVYRGPVLWNAQGERVEGKDK